MSLEGAKLSTRNGNIIYAEDILKEAVKRAANRYEPSIVARYVISLSSAFNKFFHECSILHEEDEMVKKARLCLVETVQSTISEVCGLLGITCPEEM